jgi:adenylate kinase
MNIIILGPQGSGKGTQAKMLAERYNLFYFDAGSFLRNLAKSNPDIDGLINKKGELIEDNTMFNFVRNNLEGQNISHNIIFDGYPRSVKQFELLSNWLQEKGSKIDLAILLNIGEKETIRRLSARRIDPNTGEIYNLITNPPPAHVDPKNLIQREDDKEAVIRRRLLEYHSITQPLIDYLLEKGILSEINGERPIEDIQKEIIEIIERYKKNEHKN